MPPRLSGTRQGNMSPRPYRLGERQAAGEETRARILEAARELLASPEGPQKLSVEAVAKQAGVARMTVYYQFKSKAGLLEALYDYLAARGGMDRLGQAFMSADPVAALHQFIEAFGRFWSSDRLVIRRLRSLAVLDPDVYQGGRARDDRRRQGLRVILARMPDDRVRALDFEDALEALNTLTSFETFDSLAAEDRSPMDAVPIVQQLADAVVGPSER